MGTDIHMIAEVRKNGTWNTITDKIFYNNTTFVPYDVRNYDLFAVLAGIGDEDTKSIPICKPKGLPNDIDTFSLDCLSGEHSASWFTLKEIFEYKGNIFSLKNYIGESKEFIENMEKLRQYVPKNGTLEDVRIVFDFDS